ncbi:MAG: cobalamin synthesis protein P47K [Pirellulales bacterium]|nr:cobalamin synthesis protein P47K [Pirellulales bacterium]
MKKTRVILTGGFLGAGKTTLVARAAEQLVRRGKRVGLITNDQAANLVDTAILKEAVDAVQEVAGGCFCCRFDELLTAMNRLVQTGMPDVLLGEPVGSCTDLSATVLQPMKEFYADRFQVAPFSVLVDVKQVRTLERMRKSLAESQSPRFPENVMYIYEKQLEEADLIVLNKADLLTQEELAEVESVLKQEFTQAPVITISALQGAGVEAWLDYVLETSEAGRTIAEVDYDEYAEGEAALGWLNAAIRLTSETGIDCRGFCVNLMRAMQASFREFSAEVAHLKLHLAADEHTLVANLTSNDGQPFLRGGVEGSPTEAVLLVNVRAKTDPDQLRAITQRCIAKVAGMAVQATTVDLQSFAPSRPTPTHRFQSVV